MGKLHNLLEKSGYRDHALEVLLMRLLFLLFEDNTGLWDERGLFYNLMANHTRKDGENVGTTLEHYYEGSRRRAMREAHEPARSERD